MSVHRFYGSRASGKTSWLVERATKHLDGRDSLSIGILTRSFWSTEELKQLVLKRAYKEDPSFIPRIDIHRISSDFPGRPCFHLRRKEFDIGLIEEFQDIFYLNQEEVLHCMTIACREDLYITETVVNRVLTSKRSPYV